MTGDVNFMHVFFSSGKGGGGKKEIQCSLSYLTKKIGKDIRSILIVLMEQM